MYKRAAALGLLMAAAVSFTAVVSTAQHGRPGTAPHQLGRAATPAEIAAENLTVFADGSGLPPGAGTVREGQEIFAVQCAGCHGTWGQGSGDFPALVGGTGSLATANPVLTVGSYWPYAPTLWDFIRRAMPYPRPGTLTPSRVYALSAYILHLNGIVSDTFVANRVTLPRVRMPNRNGFVPDPRPDVGRKERR